MDPVRVNLMIGWVSMIAGAVTGATIGLYFHDEAWMGGYTSLRRRMLRLGHIAFFGMGIVNVLFALTAAALDLPPAPARLASIGFATGALTMPICCFLTAWRPGLRVLFPIPVTGVLVGMGGLFAGWVLP